MRQILLAAALLLVACFSPPFQDDDAWWRLKTGQFIVQNHRLPVPDPFAFTTYIGPPDAARYFKLTHEWLSQAAMYVVFAAGGFPLVVLLRALLMAAACGLAGLVAWRRSGNFYLALGAALVSAAVDYRFASDRPELVTLLFVAAVMAAAEYRRWLWALPLLFAIWANCDAGFYLGWLVLAVYCGLVRTPKMWIVAAASVLASGLNPNGFHFSAVPLWTLSPVVAMAAWKARPFAVKWEWAVAALLLAAIALPVWQKRAFRFSSREAACPLGAVKFLMAHHTGGLLFNTAEQGGYLMWHLWPQLRVFVDGRRLNENVFRDANRIAFNEGNAFHLLDQYGVQTIVITAYDYPTGSPHFLIAMLADPNQTQWKLIYQDGQGMVFMRQPPPAVRPLANAAALASMQAQCAAHIALVPREPLCARETCKMFEHLGDLDRARFWMAYYLEHKKHPDPDAEVEYQRLTAH